MPHRPSPYRVAFDPQAWQQIGQMPTRTFQALQAALDAIAQEMDAAPQPSDGAEIERRTTAAGLVVTYQRNDATRTLTVLEIRPASPKP
jgi:hypothetical protein